MDLGQNGRTPSTTLFPKLFVSPTLWVPHTSQVLLFEKDICSSRNKICSRSLFLRLLCVDVKLVEFSVINYLVCHELHSITTEYFFRLGLFKHNFLDDLGIPPIGETFDDLLC